ncbi:4-alpha-glucanotransferase [Mollicutes bacterium LVI A0039]|nr:4-alpha-glucanotransferase [Mollicutes bacterium LVI A0039]
MNRQAGLLIPISATPGKYGVGDFGQELYKLTKIANESGFKMLQVLPLNPVGYGNSPYQSYSSSAIDPIYVDIDDLVARGLLTDAPEAFEPQNKADYTAARNLKNACLKKAFAKFSKDESFAAFLNDHQWVEDYAQFMVLKSRDESKIWYEWEDAAKEYDNLSYEFNQDDLDFYKFSQFILFDQWFKYKQFANDLGLKIIGDIPIYVSIDSHDVWAKRSNYLLDESGRPTHVAGVPPDYFSEDGQLWGNPLYDWEQLEANNFEFWIERFRHNRSMYDVIRVDHFRAFDTYWKIPAGDTTARNGEWLEAPGHALFNVIFNHFTTDEIVVEDLGDMRPEVYQLRDDFGLTGMKIIQFSLDPNETNNNFEDYENLIVYTGTHDNQTLKGWYEELSAAEQSNLQSRFGANPLTGIIEDSFKSVANLVVLPIQDVLLLDDTARFNVPGTIGEHNWTWKLTELNSFEQSVEHTKALIEKYNR